MKVLAQRANGLIFVAPFFLISLVIYIVDIFNTVYNPEHIETILLLLLDYRFIVMLISFVYMLSKWVLRVMTPKVIIEYDRAGIYIYQYKFMEPYILRYENLYSVFADIDLKEIYVKRNRFSPIRKISNPTWGMSKTGSLRIELPDHFITLHGVKNVAKVKYDLTNLIKDYRDTRDDWLEDRIEEVKRRDELAELAKHDPNT